jgi:hypothetical protein
MTLVKHKSVELFKTCLPYWDVSYLVVFPTRHHDCIIEK